MSIKALSDYIVYSRYAAHNKEKNRKETWAESVRRVFDMHREKYAEQIANSNLGEMIDFAEEQQIKKRVLASQRSLQFAKEPILKHELKIYNCLTSYVDRTRVFQEAMYALLCGCGAGLSVQKHHIHRLDKLKKPEGGTKTFVVEDSIEGWADAVGVLISSWSNKPLAEFKDYKSRNVKFDFSQIRPEGSLIAGRFKAPGPDGLKNSLERIKGVLKTRSSSDEFKTDEFKGQLRPIDAFDCLMHISDAVLSGGIRRSASLVLFSHDDKQMMAAKTGDWRAENPQRARANISTALIRGRISREEFHEVIETSKEYGEPASLWVHSEEFIYNPCCVSADTIIRTSEGNKKVKSLIGVKFKADVDGDIYPSTARGFFSSGIKSIYEMKLKKRGYSLKVTNDHKILTENRGWIQAKDLVVGDDVCIYNKDDCTCNKTSSSKFKSLTRIGLEEVYDCTIPVIKAFYANNIYVHNCEIGMMPQTSKGVSGWSACNLTEINGKKCVTKEDLFLACDASAIIGTLQAGYTNIKYLGDASKEIFEEEALLGCSITGLMDNEKVLFNPKVQREGAARILKKNAEVAKIIGINTSARSTAIKPAGHTSCVLGTASGIHPQHSKRYIRRSQVNKSEFAGKVFQQYNPMAVEESVWSANKTDNVISFLCEVPPGAITKNQITAIEFLKKVKLTQNNWIEAGTREDRCKHPKLRHNVSNTITVRPHEWGEVEKFIYDNQEYFAGISLLASSGDLDYPQAPFSTVLTPNELVKEYGDASVFASGMITDGLAAFDENLWLACDFGLAFDSSKKRSVKEPDYPTSRNYKDLSDYFQKKEDYETWFKQKDWARRLKQFSVRYFDGEIRKATYCLKHVSLWKTWCDLKREYRDVPWSEITSEEEYVEADTMGAQACSGGACEIV